MAKADKVVRMVTVTVSPRRTIQKRLTKGGPAMFFGPGQQVQVPETEIDRLVKQGFIKDPNAETLTPQQIEAASAAHAVAGGGLNITEDSDQSITEGKASADA